MGKETYTVFKCDRCQRTAEHYNTLGLSTVGFFFIQMFIKKEVCKSCYEEFKQWFFAGTPLPKEHPGAD